MREEVRQEVKLLEREFWKNQSRINGRKATKEEKVELRRRNREIWERVCELTK